MILYLQQFEYDWVVMTNVCYALKNGGGKVEAFEKYNFTQLPSQEEVIICGHGWYGKIGDYCAHVLARTMIEHGFSSSNKNNITLYSCMAGVKTPTIQLPGLAEELSTMLKVKVTAPMGLALVSEAIGMYAVKLEDTEKYDKMEVEYLKKHGYVDAQNHSLPMEHIPDLKGCKEISSAPDRAVEVSKRTMHVYKDLNTLGTKYLLDKTHGYQIFSSI